MQLWVLGVSSPRRSAGFAEAAEAAGWDGILVVDSQNLSGDPYVALAMASSSTSRLGLGTGVTNSVTRHPAVTASAIASIQRLSGGRAVLGIGRGDSALAHLGRAPVGVGSFERYLRVLQRYLGGQAVPFADLGFHEELAPPVADLGLADTPADSQIGWIAASNEPKVPVEVAATGPRVIGIGARHAERVMFTVGADPDRLRWGIETARAARTAVGLDPDDVRFGAYVNLACHQDTEVARELVRGAVTTFARFSVMHGDISGPVSGDERAVLEALRESYDMREHTRSDSRQAGQLTHDFIDRFAIAGPPEHCIERLKAIKALGIDKVAISGVAVGSTRGGELSLSAELMHKEVLPAFSSGGGGTRSAG